MLLKYILFFSGEPKMIAITNWIWAY